jgi:hypothetical protein
MALTLLTLPVPMPARSQFSFQWILGLNPLSHSWRQPGPENLHPNAVSASGSDGIGVYKGVRGNRHRYEL